MIHESKWAYGTAGSATLSINTLTLAQGKLILSDPKGQTHAYRYSGAGAGMGWRVPKSLRLPDIRLPRTRDATITGSGASTDFAGEGVIYRFTERELVPSDFLGLTIYVDFSAGLLVTHGRTGMLVGLDQRILIPWLFNPALFSSAILGTAKALIGMSGIGEGMVDGIGASLMLGRIVSDTDAID
jgi:hypothetical protein